MERRRLGETEERPVMPQNGGRVDELVDLSGGVAGVEWPEWRGRGRGVETGEAAAMRRERGRGMGLGFGEGRGARGRPRLICGASVSNSREAPRRINGPGDARGRGVGLGRSRPGRFSACYWAAIGSPTFGPCFGPARRAGVAAQALKGHRAGPALSPIDRA
jgi:hypothetical protein